MMKHNSLRPTNAQQDFKLLAEWFSILEGSVNTHHNEKNSPMIHIDRKLGYVQSPGTIVMERVLDEKEKK